ncbi:MAG TPA: UrcA family protein [Rhizomicrobium sp.]|nr:UrcA family protein [Rhizomicrobium sp.]
MTRTRIALLGAAAAALLCAGGAARAQYYAPDRYDRVYDNGVETVIVRPDYDEVQKRQLFGHINGEVNPTEFSISRPVSFSDLDLTRDADYLELRDRVRATARDLCFQLDAEVPELRGDRSADRECVRTATRNAMREVLERERYG